MMNIPFSLFELNFFSLRILASSKSLIDTYSLCVCVCVCAPFFLMYDNHVELSIRYEIGVLRLK